MNEDGFRTFLESQFTAKAAQTRLTRARKAEQILGYSLDEAVLTDEKMYTALIALQTHDRLQNSVRKYYIFKNGHEFPRLNDYRRL